MYSEYHVPAFHCGANRVHAPSVSFWNAPGETLLSGNFCHFPAELELALKPALLFRENERERESFQGQRLGCWKFK